MQRGFSLVEAIVATAIMSATTIGVVQLSIVSVRMNHAARSTTLAAVLALQKMEQLQSAGWTELVASPSGALDRNIDHYCDYLDSNGRSLAGGVSLPANAVFVRRWALDPLAAGEGLVIQVAVLPIGVVVHGVAGRGLEEARFVGIKTRH